MNADVDAALERLREALAVVEARPVEYVLVGSAVMYLHGLRNHVGDVDVFVRPRVYEYWKGAPAWAELWPRAGDPPLLEMAGPIPVHAWHSWTPRDRAWLDVSRCFALAEEVAGWQCIPLAEIAWHKRKAFAAWEGPPGEQAKHVRDLETLQRAGVKILGRRPEIPRGMVVLDEVAEISPAQWDAAAEYLRSGRLLGDLTGAEEVRGRAGSVPIETGRLEPEQ